MHEYKQAIAVLTRVLVALVTMARTGFKVKTRHEPRRTRWLSRKIISVFGSSTAQPDTQLYQDALALGRLLAQAGFTVMNGGYFGTMEAVSRGAKEAGGYVIGITLSLFDPGSPVCQPTLWLDEEIKKRAYSSRLEYLIVQSDGCIGLEGSIGTLSEVFVTGVCYKFGV